MSWPRGLYFVLVFTTRLSTRFPVHLIAYRPLYTYPRLVLPPSSPSFLPPPRPPSLLTYAHADRFSQSLLLNAIPALCFFGVVFCPSRLRFEVQ
ncbi:uncharacterized protein SCHCODRAFT_02753474 [Schizophyllum commune H4-8]|uniref:uncharacterized protein n=1 Tax=Schizophyllum commune (strain H4-8 / FGSC 9210) TaxID=578458 RepID=UPI00215F1C75|nr:uncharacterized protein SCHCODRAFT_02753474 [Schizophyllum commune H4-8]KAI5885584.1 hypothetical protein SCHCODRAFT_02753474 [Schizophyllum commune H4-8]